tara:strand:- start:14 stop:355 length:342 start_codon:yes stop_codon:yes gene_type:complete
MSGETPIFSLNKQIISSGDMSGNLISEVLDLGELTGYAVHAIWSGTPDGDLVVSGSNTQVIADFVPVNAQTIGGVAGAHMLNVEKSHYKYILVQYIQASSTGILNCHVSGKRI